MEETRPRVGRLARTRVCRPTRPRRVTSQHPRRVMPLHPRRVTPLHPRRVSGRFFILLPQAVPLQADDAEDGLAEDAAVHLGRAQLAVDEDDGHLADAEAVFVGGELHLYLEGVALEADAVQGDGLEHAPPVADEARRGVVDGQAGDEAHVFRGEVGHQHAPHGPVDHVDAADVARADGHVRPLVPAGGQEARQVGGVVAEVGVHLEDVFVVVLQGPAEAGDVGRAQSLLACALQHEEAAGEVLALQQAFHDVRRAVRRVVFHHQDVETVLQSEDGADDVLYVFPFIVGRDDDDAV